MAYNIDYIVDPSYKVIRYYWHRRMEIILLCINLVVEIILVVNAMCDVHLLKKDAISQHLS